MSAACERVAGPVSPRDDEPVVDAGALRAERDELRLRLDAQSWELADYGRTVRDLRHELLVARRWARRWKRLAKAMTAGRRARR